MFRQLPVKRSIGTWIEDSTADFRGSFQCVQQETVVKKIPTLWRFQTEILRQRLLDTVQSARIRPGANPFEVQHTSNSSEQTQ